MKKTTKRYVIYEEFGKYKMTSEKNYNRTVTNADIVMVLNNCKTKEEALQAAISAGFKKEEIIYA